MTVVQRAGKRQRTDEAGEGGGPDRKGRVLWHFIAGRNRRAVRHEAAAVPLCLLHLSLTHSFINSPVTSSLQSLVPHTEKSADGSRSLTVLGKRKHMITSPELSVLS